MPEPYVIPNPIAIRFDPYNIDQKSQVEEPGKGHYMKAIFDGPVARAIWCGLKSRHITSQYFDEDVLRFTHYLKRELHEDRSTIEDFAALQRSFRAQDPVFAGIWRKEVLEALWPYVSGQQVLQYRSVRPITEIEFSRFLHNWAEELAGREIKTYDRLAPLRHDLELAWSRWPACQTRENAQYILRDLARLALCGLASIESGALELDNT